MSKLIFVGCGFRLKSLPKMNAFNYSANTRVYIKALLMSFKYETYICIKYLSGC